MKLRRIAISLAVLSVGAVSACSAEPDPLAEIPAFAVDVARVELLDAGKDAKLLAYEDINDEDDAPATQRTVEVSEGFEQNVVAAEAVDPESPEGTDTSTLTLPLSVTTTSAPVAGDGEVEATRAVHFTAGSPTHTTATLNDELESNEGFLMDWRGNNQGRISTVKLLAPEDGADEGRAIVEAGLMNILSTAVVFPSEPVGVGGSWSVESRVTGDSTMLRTTTYTVTAIDGGTVDLDVQIEQRPSQASLSFDESEAPELAGQSLTVESSTTRSQGALTIDLSQPLPVDGEIASTTRVVYAGEDDNFRIVQDQANMVAYAE
ncbi:DUF6263 family protein [Corynebacterium breve]|uniref:DUF6263 family protein n=1 Tax=Corynebacterium breve TaxID=3049799 RepID=A0ABY8VBC0_9CORY|nr:DUF6263 family protein [Corynebacterium breve]WIM66960.1 DUF6263 family protein [Corynebacterium breve]